MHLTIPATFSIACVGVTLVFAGLSAGIGWYGGWRELRWFALVCLSAAAYNACGAVTTLGVSDDVLRLASRTSISLAVVHCMAWLWFVAADEQRALRVRERLAAAACALMAVLAAVPGVVISRDIQRRRVEWLDVTYRDALPTALGGVSFVVCLALLLFPLAHYLREWRRGTPLAWAFILGLAIMIATAANDTLVGTGLLDMPYLLDAGFVALVVASGSSIVHRFVTTSRELDDMKGKLELLVAERTEQLAQTQTALAQSEKLAAVGNLAAGVAHEINNPTSAVMANLAYLLEPLSLGQPLPSDARECLEESFASTKRIGRIVRQLLDAGRVAGGQHGRIATFPLARVVRSAVANTRAHLHKIEVIVAVDETLHVQGDEDLLAQVVVNLMINASQAISDASPSGRIDVVAERQRDSVILSVKDTGPGISPKVQSRLFEPFFTTKPQGRGTGLGLAVSLGLMRAQGGDLRLLSTSPAGTTLGVELPAADPPVQGPEPVPAAAAQRSAMRLLLVDDDPIVLDALRRTLGAWFQVQSVDTVDGALALLDDPGAFDLALCDVIMPDGGGERLLSTLADRRSSFTDRMLFMTAGAVTPASRSFVDQHRHRVLNKPIEPVQLLALASSVTRAQAAQ